MSAEKLVELHFADGRFERGLRNLLQNMTDNMVAAEDDPVLAEGPPEGLLEVAMSAFRPQDIEALKAISVEVHKKVYSEEELATLYKFYEDNPWVVDKNEAYQVAYNEASQGVIVDVMQRAGELVEKFLDELDEDEDDEDNVFV